MLPKRQARCDLDTLTWEYLDGQSSPTRLAQLETMLRTRKEARQAFVETSLLDTMLHEHFRAEAARPAEEPKTAAIQTQAVEPMPRRKRRRGKSNAA